MVNQSISAGANYVKHESREWIERLARFGFIAKGVVYVIVGVLAVMAALNMGGGQAPGKEGALQVIFNQPFGKVLAILLAVGLAGYVIWRFVQAVKDPDNVGSDTKGMVKRIGYVISGLIYAFLIFTIIRAISGSGSGGGSQSKQSLVSQVLQWDGGPFIIAAVGIIVMLTGIYQFYKAYTEKFNKKLHTERLKTDVKKWVDRAGKIGYASRGVVWLIIGYFFLQAGLQSDASNAQGTSGVFNALEQLSYGQWIALIVAIGVVAYGAFQFVKAKYYQIDV